MPKYRVIAKNLFRKQDKDNSLRLVEEPIGAILECSGAMPRIWNGKVELVVEEEKPKPKPKPKPDKKLETANRRVKK